jgi:hypothetical protein
VTSALRTRPEDVAFHRARRMFRLKDGDVKVAPEGTAMAALGLEPDVDVHIGPVDAVIRGVRYAQRRLGTLGSLIASA